MFISFSFYFTGYWASYSHWGSHQEANIPTYYAIKEHKQVCDEYRSLTSRLVGINKWNGRNMGFLYSEPTWNDYFMFYSCNSSQMTSSQISLRTRTWINLKRLPFPILNFHTFISLWLHPKWYYTCIQFRQQLPCLPMPRVLSPLSDIHKPVFTVSLHTTQTMHAKIIVIDYLYM